MRASFSRRENGDGGREGDKRKTAGKNDVV